jgi:hypothetical protein
MAITSANQCNSLSLWWQNTLARLEAILPLLYACPSTFTSRELQSLHHLICDTAYQLEGCICPSYAIELHEHTAAALWHLQSSLKAQAALNESEALCAFHLARVHWLVLQSKLEKHGIFVSNLAIRTETALALPLEY